MLVKLSKGKKIMFTIACFLVSIGTMAEMGVTPFVYNLYGAFDNQMAVNFIVSGAQLLMVIASLACTFLMKKVHKKTLLIIGSIMFAISSIFCASVNNVYYLCVMRALMGFSEGIMAAVSMAYIAQMYVDEDKRAAFMGYYNAAMSLIGAVMSYISGILANPDWHNAFKLYWPSVLIVFGIIFFFPNLDIPEDVVNEQGDIKKEKLGRLFLPFEIDYVLFTWIYCMFTYYISAYLPEMGIGGTGESGLALSLSSLAGIVFSAMFGKIYGRLRKSTIMIPLIVVPLSMLAMYFFPSLPLAYVASFLIGGTYGLYYTYSYAYVSEIVPVSRIDDAIGYTTAIYGLAFFIFTYINTGVLSIISKEGLFSPGFVFWACIAIIPIMIELFTNKAYKEHTNTY